MLLLEKGPKSKVEENLPPDRGNPEHILLNPLDEGLEKFEIFDVIVLKLFHVRVPRKRDTPVAGQLQSGVVLRFEYRERLFMNGHW